MLAVRHIPAQIFEFFSFSLFLTFWTFSDLWFPNLVFLLRQQNGRADGMPAEVLHYAQLDVDGPMENGHGPMESPRMERTGPHDYADIRPTVL